MKPDVLPTEYYKKTADSSHPFHSAAFPSNSSGNNLTQNSQL